MPGFQINWVVALRPEAAPLIEKFGLQQAVAGLYPVFENASGDTRLVVSGPGKLNAAAATATLASIENRMEPDARGWVNFGIAGSGDRGFGGIRIAGKVTDEGTGVSRYPAAVWPKKYDLPKGTVLTVEKPTDSYPPDGTLVEMEASGFMTAALRDSTLELCQVLKVVSDDPDHPIEQIDKNLVRKLCYGGIESSERWLDAFRALGEEDARRLADPPGWKEVLEMGHFTATRQHQLRRLLQQWTAKNPEKSVMETPIAELRNGGEILSELRKAVFEDASER